MASFAGNAFDAPANVEVQVCLNSVEKRHAKQVDDDVVGDGGFDVEVAMLSGRGTVIFVGRDCKTLFSYQGPRARPH